MPSSEWSASRSASRLGLRYDTIDACKNGCILFRKTYAELYSCPVCQFLKFQEGGNVIGAAKGT